MLVLDLLAELFWGTQLKLAWLPAAHAKTALQQLGAEAHIREEVDEV